MAKFQVKGKILLLIVAEDRCQSGDDCSLRVLSHIATAKRSVANVPLAPPGNTKAKPCGKAAILRTNAANPAIPVTTPIPLISDV